MEILTIAGIILVLAVTLIVYLKERKHKLIYTGRNQYVYVIAVILIVFIAYSYFSYNTLRMIDIIVVIAIIPMGVIGNKCGITEDGILMSSHVTTWDKIKSYSVIEEKNKYILFFESSDAKRKITFSKEKGKEVDNYLKTNRKLRHRRK